jgi:histone H3/H4
MKKAGADRVSEAAAKELAKSQNKSGKNQPRKHLI